MSSSSTEQPPTKKSLNLRSNFLWTLFGNGIFAASQWLILIALTKQVPEKMVGQFFLGLTVSSPLLLFTDMNLRAVLVADAKNRFRYADYMKLRLWTFPVAVLLMLIIVFASGYEWQAIIVIFLVFAFKGFEAIGRITHAIFQRYERMDKVSISMMLRGTFSAIALSIMAYTTKQVSWAILGVVVINACIFFFYDLPQSLSFAHTHDEERTIYEAEEDRSHQQNDILGLLKHAYPLGLSALFGSLIIYIPNYILEMYHGEEVLGIYSAMFYLGLLGNMVMGALGQATSARMARAHTNGDVKGFLRLLFILILIALCVGGGLIFLAYFFGPKILTLLYKASYAKHHIVFVWIAISVSCSFLDIALSYGMLASQSFKSQSLIFGVSNLIILGFCLLWIPKYGMLGTVWALTANYVIKLTFMAIWNAYTISKLKQKFA
ncbi:MAG: hypothetical protein CL932_10900 [Deltaproteobacteria bacterium]|nr:hypothetical protein [Deltaproteobacteria bacterium]MBK05276.1 hypothetical protein [Deltaproteobacteria bacterium]|tara:strand:+ start:15215 stop:16519 length:1305 start_codon:yes stop_codon:yes gene_type:complete